MKQIMKKDFFITLFGKRASFDITGLAYLGGLGFWKRRGRAHKWPSSSTRTGISKTRGGENHGKIMKPLNELFVKGPGLRCHRFPNAAETLVPETS